MTVGLVAWFAVSNRAACVGVGQVLVRWLVGCHGWVWSALRWVVPRAGRELVSRCGRVVAWSFSWVGEFGCGFGLALTLLVSDGPVALWWARAVGDLVVEVACLAGACRGSFSFLVFVVSVGVLVLGLACLGRWVGVCGFVRA